MSTDRELKAFDETEIDALLEVAAKYELLHEQFKKGNNVERAMVDLLERVSTVLRRCHKTIRELQSSRPLLPEGGVREVELREALAECCRMFEWCDARYGKLLLHQQEGKEKVR